MSKWPKPYTDEKEPPRKIYLGFDEEAGRQTVTWWIWPTMPDDVCYIRSDIVAKELKEIIAIAKGESNAYGKHDPEMGKESTEA